MDEADECLNKHREALSVCLDAACSQEDKPTFGFVGATIDSTFQKEIIEAGWPQYPAQVQGAGSSLVPPAIQHRCRPGSPRPLNELLIYSEGLW